MGFLDIVAEFSAILSSLGIRHAVGGSIASSAWGEPRHTNDADFLVQLDPGVAEDLLRELPEAYYAEPRDVREAARDDSPFASFQALYLPSTFKLDCFVGNSDWHGAQLDRVVFQEIRPGVSIPFVSAEDMIVAKCRRFDLGHRVSDRQWNDLVRLYEVQRDHLDAGYIERWLSQFGLLDLWAEIRAQSKA